MEEKKEAMSLMNLLLLILLIIFVFMLLGRSLFSNSQMQPENSTMMFLGFLGILLIVFALLRLLTRVPTPTQKITLTVLQCTKCAFKSIRNFQVGDYIPKIVGNCPSCGGPFRIEAIYVEEKTQKRKIPF
ncbi:MAG: hypothetical protein B6U77_00965 [Candidatus Hecatellales archaeon ex4484_218]|nr:MAG: hypothetical protein B6U77_00965 [Candidatus Hecatellales archaeon ex4484_218]